MATFGFQTNPSVNPTTTNAAFSWANQNPGDGQAFVGLDPANLPMNNGDGTLDVLNHVVTVPDPFSAPLTPATQYYYAVRSTNSSGVVVAASDPQPFYTAGVIAGTMLDKPDANPRRIPPGTGASVVCVMVLNQGQPVAGVGVTFNITDGMATIGPVGQSPAGNSVTVLSDGSGLAQAALKAGANKCIVKVSASSQNTGNSYNIPVAVEGN
ncbi:MAG TPA: hypothetical protein VJ873_14355 [bacterium]|nr:hypothetical protein [bacterium]